MEMAYNTVDGMADLSSCLIRCLAASNAFLFSSSSVQSQNHSKFFDSLVQGITNFSYLMVRRKTFFLAIKNASKILVFVGSALDGLLKCLKFSWVCATGEVLDLIVQLKDKIVGENKAKNVASGIYPLFVKLKYPKPNSAGDVWEISMIMEIMCTVLGENNITLRNFIDESCSLVGGNSLSILEVLAQNSFPTYSSHIEKATEYILRFHLEYIKGWKYSGDEGTTSVVAKVVGNCPKFVSQKNMEIALDILNECRKLYPKW